MIDGKGERKNSGKARYDLLPSFATKQGAMVYTVGADKYADRNWERGMSWSKVTASLKRHLAAFEAGEDFDPETGLLHVAHLKTNAEFLIEYYKIFPQGDDRPRYFTPRVGLDIDEVLADFVGAWCGRYNVAPPLFWKYDYKIDQKFEELKTDKDFWMNIRPLVRPEELLFEPHCYITGRIIPVEWTMEWLEKNGFATAPVVSIGHNGSKLEHIKSSGAEVFVDDRYDTYRELTEAGICCYLLTREHNKKYDVGFKRLYALSDLVTLDHLRGRKKIEG